MSTEKQSGNAFITREHPEYVKNRHVRSTYRDLYLGGQQFKNNASYHLVRRHKEPNDVYFERLSRVFYENYIGSIIDWYTATLFRREPVIQLDGPNESGKSFLNGFIQDCDRRGTTLTDFYRTQMTQALVFGRSYIALDFPRAITPAFSRAQEDAAGLSRAYLVDYSTDEVINWSYDSDGVLEWIVIRTSGVKQSNVRDENWNRETQWLYYNRDSFELYVGDSEIGSGKTDPVLVAAGPHALASQHRVPVFELKVSDGFWLMNKASLLQMEHFNKSNALSWALTMGLFATPVIYSDREFSQIVGESYFIQLGPQDRFGWTEPAGNVYQIAADNLVRLRDEIYRVCYMNNGISSHSHGGGVQSGLSKLWDFSVTQEVLRTFGDVAKSSMRAILNAVSEARLDGIQVDVSGVDEFDIQDFTSELLNAQNLLGLGIPSETLTQQVYKRLALKYLSDSRQDVKTKIADEIDRSLGRSN